MPIKIKDQLVTIAEAQTWFEKSGTMEQQSALREMINVMITNNIKTQFENDSYFDALMLTEVMLDRSKRSVELLTGSGCEKFLTTLKRSFAAVVARLNTTGGKVRIILFSSKIPDVVSELKAEYPEALEIRLARLADGAKSPLGHFFVCDSKMARVEEPHGELTAETPANAIKAKVYFNDPARGQLLESRFNTYWEIVSPPVLAPSI